MKKYYIGLAIIGILTVGLLIYVLNVGAQGKQDNVTYEKAVEVSEKLNGHINKEQKIPENLNEIGVSDIPDTIKYERLSSSKYKICITYKTGRSYGSGDITSTLTGAALTGMYGSSERFASDYQSSYFYPSFNYEKGENCQTIEPNIYDFDSSDSCENSFFGPSSCNDFDSDTQSSEGSLYSQYCSTEEDRETFESYCKALETEQTQPSADEL